MERTKQEITEAREKMRSAKQRGGGNNSERKEEKQIDLFP